MSKRYLNKLENYAEQLRLSFDEETLYIFGKFNGYIVLLEPMKNYYNLKLSIKHRGEMPDSRLIKQVMHESKDIRSYTVKGYQVNYILNAGITGKKVVEKLQEAMKVITDFLKANGFENCCQSCGTQEAEIGIYKVEGIPMILCEDCFKKRYEQHSTNEYMQKQKKENLVAGSVGALLGSLVGVLAIVILGQMGYVAALSGIIMAVCSLKGYEILGGRLSNKGIIGSVVLMILMVYVGNRLDWSVSVANYAGIDIPYAFQILPSLFAEGYLDSSDYYINLVMVYLFTAVGAAPTISNILRNRKLEGESYKMNY